MLVSGVNNGDTRTDAVKSEDFKFMENKITKVEQNPVNKYFVIQREKVAWLKVKQILFYIGKLEVNFKY